MEQRCCGQTSWFRVYILPVHFFTENAMLQHIYLMFIIGLIACHLEILPLSYMTIVITASQEFLLLHKMSQLQSCNCNNHNLFYVVCSEINNKYIGGAILENAGKRKHFYPSYTVCHV